MGPSDGAAGDGGVRRSEGTTANGSYAFEKPSFHLGQNASPHQVRQALTDAATSFADGVRDVAEQQGLSHRRRPGMAGAMLTPDGEVHMHSSMKADRSRTPHLEPKPHPLVKLVLDGIDARLREQGTTPPKSHGSCAEVALVSDRIYELAAQWNLSSDGAGGRSDASGGVEGRRDSDGGIGARLDAVFGINRDPDSPGGPDSAPPLDSFIKHVIDELKGSVVTTHRIGDVSFGDVHMAHGEFTPPCATCTPLLKFFEIEHLSDWGPDQPLPHGDGGGLPTGSIDPGRPYGVPGGLAPIDPNDVARLEAVIPRGPEGEPLRYPDPREGSWLKAINGGGTTVPGRSNNCVDCVAAFAATWYGDPTVAAPRSESTGGEANGDSRLADAFGAPFRDYGDARGLDVIRDELRQAGPGSMAAVRSSWTSGGRHIFAMVNVDGEILVVDPQTGQLGVPSTWSARFQEIHGIVLDPQARPVTPPAEPAGPATSEPSAGAPSGGPSDEPPADRETPGRDDRTPEGDGEQPGGPPPQPATLDQTMYDYLRPSEVATAERLARHPDFAGRTFTAPPPPDPGYDWSDDRGRTYDALGNGAMRDHFDWRVFRRSIDKHLLKANDYTVIDMTGYTPEQIELVRRYLDSLPPKTDRGNAIVRIGFDAGDPD